MNAAFDTHAAVKRLAGAGFTETQAEALSDTVHRAVTGGVATKADLAGLETRIEARLSGVEARISRIETDLTWIKRIGALIVALLAVPVLRDILTALPL